MALELEPQHIFLVHGIGHHSEGWSKSWQDTFLDRLMTYSPFRGEDRADVQDVCQFVEITYDDTFEGIRQEWSDLGKALTAVKSNLAFVSLLQHLDSTSPASSFETFFWENMLDVALWFGFKEARSAVIANVVAQLTEELQQRLAGTSAVDRPNLSNFHVIAHSLGTSVIHDALVSLSRSKPTAPDYGTKLFRFQNLVTVANTSLVMESPFDLDPNLPSDAYRALSSNVCPSTLKSRDAVCRNYVNVRHELDPVTWPRMFDPISLDPNDWKAPDYLQILESRFLDITHVHDLEHYFASPRVHVQVFRRIFGNTVGGEDLGSADETTQALKVWQAATIDGGDPAAEVRKLFDGDRIQKLTLMELMDLLGRISAKVRLHPS
jgi:hypothetical protein